MKDRARYQPGEIEPKWQSRWEADGLYRSRVDWDKPKHYALTMLPYPSGDLHIGHWYAMTPSDARARFMRMRGYNVLFPMGFDAFGLPAENAAVQRNIHPWKWTYSNIERMRKQLKSMGAMFDWEREAISCTPAYYRWTEWFFKRFFENALAYRGEALVNWSPTLQTVLANEQVIDGKDERTGQPVIQRMMEQWFFAITKYVEELLDFSKLDWPEPIKLMQTNWVGRSEGARVVFHTEDEDPIEIFTTRPDTLWGATFMVLAPEHPLVDKVTRPENAGEVAAYKEAASQTTEIERVAEGREKSGVFTGGYAINPVNNARIPIWIADYVLITYGSGAIMAVPAHDQRDFEFARKFGLQIIPVIQPEGEELDGDTMTQAYEHEGVMVNSGLFDGTPATEAKGSANPAIRAVTEWLEEQGIGEGAVQYRLRDWLISRQRYWGAPIPVIFKQDGSIEAVPEDELPVLLPEDVDFLPTGQSPLNLHAEFLNTRDQDGQPARRETDTMDTFMCSSWYQYRYLSPDYADAPFDPEEGAYWLPVDTYTGGAEHATLHLMYTRFFTKAMRDLGVFEETAERMRAHGRDPAALFDEPMMQLRNQGQILGEESSGDFILAHGAWQDGVFVANRIDVVTPSDVPEGFDGVAGEIMRRSENLLQVEMPGDSALQRVELAENAEIRIPSIRGDNTIQQLRQHLDVQRMSKSKGNVVNPDELVKRYGADTVRAYLMFFARWEQGGPWNSQGIEGTVRWLRRVWSLFTEEADLQSKASNAVRRTLRRKVHQTLRQLTDDLEQFQFNTVISGLMELLNEMITAKDGGVAGTREWAEAQDLYLRMMAPVTPHIAEELWSRLGKPYSIHQQPWPEVDPEAEAEEEITLVVQVNGKLRERIQVRADISEDDAKALALESETVQRFVAGKTPKKIIYVAGRLVNIVV